MLKRATLFSAGLVTSFLCDRLVSQKKPSKSKSVLISSGVALLGVASSLAFHSKDSLFFGGGASLWATLQALRNPKNTSKNTPQDALGVDVSFKEANESLESLLAQNGISPPRTPQTLKVVMDVFDLKGNQVSITRYYWRNLETDDAHRGWVPASVVKVFAAVSALQRLSELGFDATTQIIFKDTGETISIAELINRTIIDSNNMTYNRLVQLAGHSRMSEMLAQHFPNTELNTPYILEDWKKHTQGNSRFDAPLIEISDATKRQVLEPNTQSSPKLCRGVSACTRLSELNNLMAQSVIFQNLQISENLSHLLLTALSASKPRGAEFSNAIQANTPKYAFTAFHKHGFNGEWYSQTVVLLNENQKAFVVSAVGAKGDRTLLNDVGRAIGELIQKAF